MVDRGDARNLAILAILALIKACQQCDWRHTKAVQAPDGEIGTNWVQAGCRQGTWTQTDAVREMFVLPEATNSQQSPVVCLDVLHMECEEDLLDVWCVFSFSPFLLLSIDR